MESFISKKRNKENDNICQICKINKYKYTCPKCFIKTCSVNCVKNHKKRFKCNGIRDKFKKISKNTDYNEKVFFRDMKYLSNTINEINTSNKIIYNLNENIDNNNNKIFKNFKRICKKFRNINYFKSPNIFEISKLNKNYCDSTNKKIYWTIKLNFIENNIIQIFKNKQFDDEEYNLNLICEYLTNNKNDLYDNNLLNIISEKNWNLNYNIYYKLNNINNVKEEEKKNLFLYNKFYYEICDKTLLLKDLLNNKNVYEFPEFFFFKNN